LYEEPFDRANGTALEFGVDSEEAWIPAQRRYDGSLATLVDSSLLGALAGFARDTPIPPEILSPRSSSAPQQRLTEQGDCEIGDRRQESRQD
jgi:hypothetical protein